MLPYMAYMDPMGYNHKSCVFTWDMGVCVEHTWIFQYISSNLEIRWGVTFRDGWGAELKVGRASPVECWGDYLGSL